MRRVGLLFFCIFVFVALNAVPEPMHILQGPESKTDKFAINSFHFHNNQIYAVDTKLNEIRKWNLNTKSWQKDAALIFPKTTKISDITTDENNLYVLESANSQISIYDLGGKLVRLLETKGSPDCQFRNAIRILVNYQGYIYVLDQGRGQLISLSNEGMFMGKADLAMPLGMTLGEDQILRVLHVDNKLYYVSSFDLNLKQLSRKAVQGMGARDDLVDIEIDRFGDLYMICGRRGQIGKYNPEAVPIPRSQFGSKGSRVSPGSFDTPVLIRITTVQDNTILGIYDSKHRAIQLFTESEKSANPPLVRPLYTMRPFLTVTDDEKFLDFLPTDSLYYYINEAPAGKGGLKKPGIQISCTDLEGKELFYVLAANLKKQKVRSFSSMALHNGQLFVTDNGANAVHVFDRFTGKYQSSFGEGGSGDGKLRNPSSIAIGPDGTIYIADTNNSRLTLWSIHGMFMESIDYSDKKLKPTQIRLANDRLYMLANGTSLYSMPLNSLGFPRLLREFKKISSFELLYDGRIGIVDGSTQNLLIYNQDALEHTYFSFSSKADFPFFSDIYAIRYIPELNELRVCDSKSAMQRNLRFFYSPLEPQGLKLKVLEDRQVELSWEQGVGISTWIVYEYADKDTIYYTVTEPRHVIKTPQKTISSFRVAAFAEDNKIGPPSAAIEDAYSYARYLISNLNYAQAAAALKRAANTIPDDFINQEIATTYLHEAQYYAKFQEYERALSSLNLALAAAKNRKDLILETINIYKLMKAYGNGIRFIKTGGYESDPEVHRQLISLYYLYLDYFNLITEASRYLKDNYGDAGILKYLVIGHEAMENYQDAVTAQRLLLASEDSYENHLKLAELLYLANQTDDSISQLQRMLTRYPQNRHDEVYFLYGNAHMKKNQVSLACERYESAIKINPDKAEFQFGLAKALFADRKLGEAQGHYERAWRLNPTNIEYSFAYANALEKANMLAEALSVLDQISTYVTADSTSIGFHELYGDLLLRNQRYDDAYRELSLALRFFPDNQAIQSKYESVIEAREAYHRDRPPLEVVEFVFHNLYPSLQEYYRSSPLGYVSIFNTRNVPIQNVRMSIQIPQITNLAFETTVPSILANEKKTIDIISPINQAVFELCKNNELDITTYLNIHYSYNGEEFYIPQSAALRALRIQAMNWDNRRQFACFINPDDQNVRGFVNNRILQLFSGSQSGAIPRNIMRAMQIYSYFHANGVVYVSDPTTSNVGDAVNDFVQYPTQTIRAKGGDCDDLVSLLASAMSSIGLETGFLDVEGHVILVFDVAVGADQILEAGFDISHFIYRNNKYWLPVEATVLGKNGFNMSWMAALKRYQNILERGVLPDLVEFLDAHRQYPPVNYSENVSDVVYDKDAAALEAFNTELKNILLINQITKDEEFVETLRRYPDNSNVRNQYALWCVEMGKLDIAETQWLQLIQRDPNHFSALVNLGNLYLRKQDFNNARRMYQRALQQNREKDNLFRNLCLLEYRAGELLEARSYYNSLTDKNVMKNIDPKIIADLVGMGD